MIKIYITPTCSSCRKAKKWLDEHNVKYKEINLLTNKLTVDDLNLILKNTENGFEDIVSPRSKIIKESNIDINEMTVSELKEFIINNPTVLRRPIIVDDDRLQIGYNEEDIDVFMPEELRKLMISVWCNSDDECDYKTILKRYLEESRKNDR
ncbi:MAG: transcriptional regulator Spx [Acholeplasmatales bacterium]|nr:transcriptional regulator Spx [Acholeplasmatales bacterium]